MKTGNSITISSDLLEIIDRLRGKTKSRSEFIESLLRKYLNEEKTKKPGKSDLEIINRNSEYLNKEAEEVLSYQVNSLR